MPRCSAIGCVNGKMLLVSSFTAEFDTERKKSIIFHLHKGNKSCPSRHELFFPQWWILSDEEKLCCLSQDTEDENSHMIITDYSLQSDLANDILEYTAGYIAWKIKSKIMCEDCINLLFSKDISYRSLIYTSEVDNFSHIHMYSFILTRVSFTFYDIVTTYF